MEFYILVRLHRWQPKSNRYRDQIFRLGPDEQQCFMDLVFRRGAQLAHDAGAKPVIMRTQQVDRIGVAAADKDSVVFDVWTSPIIERKYTRAHPATNAGARKATERDRQHMCVCHHLDSDHADKQRVLSDGTNLSYGLCLIPGCACKCFEQLQRVQLPKVLNTATRPAGGPNERNAEPLADVFDSEESDAATRLIIIPSPTCLISC